MKDSRSLYNLFTRLNNTFSKDSSDCISTLSTALQLLRLLVELDDSPETQRTETVTAKQLALVCHLVNIFAVYVSFTLVCSISG